MESSTTPEPSSTSERFKTIGRVRFSKNTERTVFFFLTLAMLAAGLLVKIELWWPAS